MDEKIIDLPVNAYVINQLIKKYNFKIGAELGVRRGEFTISLIENNPELKMIAIDLWHSNPVLTEKYDHIKNFTTFIERAKFFSNNLIMYKGLISDASKDINLNPDFIYIDATHTRDALKNDLINWYPKVKDTGIICGHDYHSSFDSGKVVQIINEYIGISKEYPSDKNNDYHKNENEVLSYLDNSNGGIVDHQTTCWYCWKNQTNIFKNKLI